MIVRFTRRAEEDLAEIVSYLARHSPQGARKVGASLMRLFELSLSTKIKLQKSLSSQIIEALHSQPSPHFLRAKITRVGASLRQLSYDKS